MKLKLFASCVRWFAVVSLVAAPVGCAAVKETGRAQVEEVAPEAPKVDEVTPEAPKVDEVVPEAPKVDEVVPEAPKVEKSGIPVLRGASFRIGDFHLAGQPLQPDFDIAKEKGVKTVINVRMDRELAGLGFEEDRTIEELGLEYVHIPVSPETIDDELAEKFLEAMRKTRKPVLLHGSNGNRVWGLWALYVGMESRVRFEETAQLAEQCGVKKLVVDEFVRDYLKRKRGLD